MNNTFEKLKKLIGTKLIVPQELSGGKFKSIDGAREVAKKCQKSVHKLTPIELTAKVLGVEKAFYTMIEESHVLFIIDGETASIEIIPDIHDTVYNCYRVVADKWQWWSMGAHLSMMMESLKNQGAKKFEFNENFIIGIQDQETIYCLSALSYPHKELDNFLPPIPPKIVIPPPVKKVKVVEVVEEIKVEEPVVEEKPKKKIRNVK